MNHAFLLFLMLLAGVGIPVMAALNANMGQHVGNPVTAVMVLCAVALVTATVLLAVQPQPAGFGKLADAPRAGFIAGFFFIFYIASITYAAPRVGLGNAVIMVLVGQVIAAALIDHFGLFGTESFPITPRRLAGFGLLVSGFWLVTTR